MISRKSGVYCFRNTINNKIYIGSTNCLRQRYANHKSQAKRKKRITVIQKAFFKYGFDNFEFKVLLTTKDYCKWEEILIRLLKPEYNACAMVNGNNQPNLGKKFDQDWIDSLGKCTGHSESTRKHLAKINKENACTVSFTKGNQTLTFNSWVEASEYFKTSPTVLIIAYKRCGRYKKYSIKQLTTQTKRVLLTDSRRNSKEFDSASECDRFLNLWRGATSNAIRNKDGSLHNYRVEYI